MQNLDVRNKHFTWMIWNEYLNGQNFKLTTPNYIEAVTFTTLRYTISLNTSKQPKNVNRLVIKRTQKDMNLLHYYISRFHLNSLHTVK